MKVDDPQEFINRRRRQIHVHSVIYYHFHTNLISDAVYDTWSVELANVQKEHPELKHKGYLAGVFADWTGDTGMHLPVTDAAYDLANRLVKSAQNRMGTLPQIQSKSREKPVEKINIVGYESI